jgi:glycosyltransferase involved in cell wall biosynthesis
MISGAALTAQQLARGQAARGHAVLVVAASDHGSAYHNTTHGVQVARLRSFPNPLRAQQRFTAWPGPALLATLRSFRPQIIHLHDPLNMGQAALDAARGLGCPAVLTLHALPSLVAAYAPRVLGLPRLVEAVLWAYGQAFTKRCQALVAPSAAVAAVVQARTGRTAELISDGVDLDLFTPTPASATEADDLRRKYRLDPRLPVILYVGRLDMEKRVQLALQAAARVLRAAPAQMLIVGDGTQRAALIELSRRLGIGERTHFAGYVEPSGDLPGLYRLATVFVMASEVETEGVVVVEAGASGLPIVAVRATSLPEIVDDGRTGCLVPPGDEAAMADRLLELVRDPARARAMGQAGRAKLAHSHGFGVTVDSYDRLYARLVAAAEEPGGKPAPHTTPAAGRSQVSEDPKGLRDL